MFGKNKKKEEVEEIKQDQKQTVIHTMDDDLNSEYEKKSITVDERTKDTPDNIGLESPFSKASNYKQKILTSNSLDDNKVKHSVSTENKSKISSNLFQKHQNNVFSEKSKKPFANNTFSSIENAEDGLLGLKKDSESVNHSNFGQKTKTTIEDRLDKIKESSLEAKMDYTDEIVEHNDKGGVLKKVIYLIVVLALIGIIIVGGYYLWINKDKIVSLFYTNEKIRNEIQSSDNDMEGSIEEKFTNEFSDRTNFLRVDVLTKDNITSAIKQTFNKMPENKLVEFIIVDNDNVKLLFPEFSNAIGFSLDPKIMKNLKDEFSIFLYKKTDSDRRVSLLIDISDKELLLGAISASSNALVQEIRPLFLDASVSEDKELSGFSTSVYEDVSIRYNNLNEKSDLSLDYAIINDKLMLATSKDSGRLIIDKVVKESNVEENMSNSTIDSENIEIIIDDNSNIN